MAQSRYPVAAGSLLADSWALRRACGWRWQRARLVRTTGKETVSSQPPGDREASGNRLCHGSSPASGALVLGTLTGLPEDRPHLGSLCGDRQGS